MVQKFMLVRTWPSQVPPVPFLCLLSQWPTQQSGCTPLLLLCSCSSSLQQEPVFACPTSSEHVVTQEGGAGKLVLLLGRGWIAKEEGEKEMRVHWLARGGSREHAAPVVLYIRIGTNLRTNLCGHLYWLFHSYWNIGMDPAATLVNYGTGKLIPGEVPIAPSETVQKENSVSKIKSADLQHAC